LEILPEFGLSSRFNVLAGELCAVLSPVESRSTLKLLLCLALSVFLSLNLSCSKLELSDRGLLPEPLLGAEVILVLLLEIDSGREECDLLDV